MQYQYIYHLCVKRKIKIFSVNFLILTGSQESDADLGQHSTVKILFEEVELKKFNLTDDLKEFVIDFGNTKYAALLTSKIIEGFEYDKNAVFKFETSDFGA